MKCQRLFTEKNGMILSSAELAQRVVKVKSSLHFVVVYRVYLKVSRTDMPL